MAQFRDTESARDTMAAVLTGAGPLLTMTLTDALSLAETRGEQYATGTEGWNWWRARREGPQVRFEFWQTWWLSPRWETDLLRPSSGVDWVPGELDVTRPPWEH